MQAHPSTRDGSRNGPAIKRVMVATDATPNAMAAELAGIELARREQASLVLLSAIDPSRLRLPGGPFHTRVDQVRAVREAALTAIVEEAHRLAVPAQYLIWEGDPGVAIVDAAAAEGADVIVVGSHARGPVGRFLLGSVSSYVVAHARQPVVVIRPGQRLNDMWPGPTAQSRSPQAPTQPSRRGTTRPSTKGRTSRCTAHE